jgi:hypothetical protein
MNTLFPTDLIENEWLEFPAEGYSAPAIVFEVRVRNMTSAPQECRLVFSFPGPTPDAAAWSRIATALPTPAWTDFGRSVAVDVSVAPGEERIVRFADALEVARFMARGHAALLSRVLGWQGVLYAESSLPVWLRESLANFLHLFPMCSF